MLSAARRLAVTEEALKDFEDKGRLLMEEKDIRNDYQVLVMDETGDDYNKAPAKVAARKSASGATVAQGPGEKGVHATIVVGAFGDGTYTRPTVIHKGERVAVSDVGEVEALCGDDAIFYKTPSGGSNLNTMIWWLEGSALPYSQRKDGEWLILILDQYWWHCDLAFLDFCLTKNVCVFGGIPHGSDKWQIPDTHYNRPLKAEISTIILDRYLHDGWTAITIAEHLAAVLAAHKKVLTVDFVRKSFVDNGHLPPFTVFEALKHKTTTKVSEQAASGVVAARPTLRRRQTDQVPDLPDTPSTLFALDPTSKWPATAPDKWSKEDIYQTLRESVLLHQGALAIPAIDRRTRVAGGEEPKYLGAKAQNLTNSERMAALRREKEEKLAAAEAKRKRVEERKASQKAFCGRCPYKVGTLASLRRHYTTQHQEQWKAPKDGDYCVPNCSQKDDPPPLGCENLGCSRGWFHIACVGLDSLPAPDIPYWCDLCKHHAT